MTGSGTVTGPADGINCSLTPAGVSGACSGTFFSGAVINLYSTPAAGSTFTSWSGGDCFGTTQPCTTVMSAAQTVTVTFTAGTYSLTIDEAGSGSGTVDEHSGGNQLSHKLHGEFPGGHADYLDRDSWKRQCVRKLERAGLRRKRQLFCDVKHRSDHRGHLQSDLSVNGDVGGNGSWKCDEQSRGYQLHERIRHGLHGKFHDRISGDVDGDGSEREHVCGVERARGRLFGDSTALHGDDERGGVCHSHIQHHYQLCIDGHGSGNGQRNGDEQFRRESYARAHARRITRAGRR